MRTTPSDRPEGGALCPTCEKVPSSSATAAIDTTITRTSRRGREAATGDLLEGNALTLAGVYADEVQPPCNRASGG